MVGVPNRLNSWNHTRVCVWLIYPIILLWLLPACAPREVKPPPPTGEIIAQFSHGVEALDASYSVGRLGDRLQVVGEIVNTYLSDLDYFKLELNVIDADGQVVFKDETATIDIKEHYSYPFVFSVPPLHGPHWFKFNFEYVYYEFAETGRGGAQFVRSDSSEWSYFEDMVDLP